MYHYVLLFQIALGCRQKHENSKTAAFQEKRKQKTEKSHTTIHTKHIKVSVFLRARMNIEPNLS